MREKWYMTRHGAAILTFDNGEIFGEAPDGTRADTMPRRERKVSDEVEISFLGPRRLSGKEFEAMTNDMARTLGEIAKEYGYTSAHGRRRVSDHFTR
jgi:hypothetical protein